MRLDRRWLRRARLAWLLVIVGITTAPWSDFKGHAHWEAVDWLPFGPQANARDAALNGLLFVPFGFLFWPIPAWSPRVRVLAVLGSSLLLSLASELYQVFCHSRYVNATDVMMNVAGALAGCGLAFLVVTPPRERDAPARRSPDSAE